MVSMTIIGTAFEGSIGPILRDLNINEINTINPGMFGNFKTLTYLLDIPDEDVVRTRKSLLSCIKERIPFAKCLCEYGNWNRIYVVFQRKKQLV